MTPEGTKEKTKKKNRGCKRKKNKKKEPEAVQEHLDLIKDQNNGMKEMAQIAEGRPKDKVKMVLTIGTQTLLNVGTETMIGDNDKNPVTAMSALLLV